MVVLETTNSSQFLATRGPKFGHLGQKRKISFPASRLMFSARHDSYTVDHAEMKKKKL